MLKKQIIYNSNNKEKIKARNKIYNNKLEVKERRNLRENNRIKNDPMYKFITDIRKFVYVSLKRGGVSKSKIKISTENLLGCNFVEFKAYIEEKFELWMDWNNWGRYTGNYNETWQLDHIEPLNTAKNADEVISLNHFSNFQPLCSRKNLEKNFKNNRNG